MSTTDCHHIAENQASNICVHLFDGKTEQFYRYFNGNDKQYDLVCPKCRTYLEKFELNMKQVCHSCFDKIEVEGNFFEYVGKPSYDQVVTDYSIEYQEVDVPALRYHYIVAMQAMLNTQGSQWLVFDGMGNVQMLDLACNTLILINQIDNDLIDRAGEVHIVVSPEAEYAVIISRSRLMKESKEWNKGIVIDLITGEVTMTLDRGLYHTAISELSVAFFRHEQMTLLVHSTDWNRLDISDPSTGHCLTERDFDKRPSEAWRFNKGQLSEFSGRLTVSPNQQWLVNDGWRWGPMGCLSAFNLQHWINKNVWEADNGPTKLNLTIKEYFWGAPSCWVNDNTLCVWGQGTDDENIISAAVLYDLYTGEQIDWFPGPGRGLFVYDKLLYTTEDESFYAWDITNGNQVIHEKGFSPQLYHETSCQFLDYKGKGIFMLAKINLESDLDNDL